MKLIASAFGLLVLAAPAQAQYNHRLVNDTQLATGEVISWIQAGNADKTCNALVKAEVLATKLNDGVAMEAAAKTQVAALRAHTQRMGVFCAFAY